MRPANLGNKTLSDTYWRVQLVWMKVLSDAEENDSVPFNRGGIADLPLLRTLLALCQKSRDKFLESDGLFVLLVYASLAASRSSQKNTSLSELCFRFRRFILLTQTKNWFLWTMAAAQAAEKHADKWGFTWHLRWGIYTSIPTWTH